MSEAFVRTISPDDLARLKAGRDAADARYNAALTAVDEAVQRLPPLPHPPPGPDEHQVSPLNDAWDVMAAAPSGGGWRGRLARLVWRLMEPALARQQRFNSLLVDHVNRNVARERAVPPAIESTIALVKSQIEASIHFQSRLIAYLQAVTPFVDTKDYEFAGLARRATEDAAEHAHRVDLVTRGFAAGLSGLSDEVLKRYEALTIDGQRRAAAIDELRTAVAVVQQSAAAIQRQLERGPSGAPAAATATTPPSSAGAPSPAAAPSPASGAQQLQATDPLRSHRYVGFEDVFRGAEADIRARMQDYVARFAGARDVLDVGCGRGEFLDLLREHGIPARGIDLNVEMVERCRAKGLDVVAADVVDYLCGLDDGALGGLIATQVVEHLAPDVLMEFLELAFTRLRPGAAIVLETINTASWSAFFESYIRDLTHVRPIHPETLRFLLVANGFRDAEIEWRAPYPEHGKLERLDPPAGAGDPGLDALTATLNRNVDRLNTLMFGPRDFAAIARRP